MNPFKYASLSAVLLGAFAVLGFAPFYFFPTTIIALIGIFYLWAKAPSAIASFKLGLLFGLGLYISGIYWIYISLHDFGGMPWWFAGFCTFCLCAFMALFPALVGYFSKRLGCLMISAPILWGLSDWVRSWIFTGFPWLTMGYSQTPHSPLAGYMPIIGVYGVSTITALLAACIAIWLAEKYSVSAIWKRPAIATVTLTIVIGLGLKAVEWTKPIHQPFDVSLIQGNIPQNLKWDPNIAQRTLNQYLSMTKDSEAQLVILPETAFPMIASRLPEEVPQILDTLGQQRNSNIIVGLVEYNPDTEQYFNSAISYGSNDRQTYRKNHLVPFGEFIPLKQVFGWVYRDWLSIPLSDLARGGAHQRPMQLNNQKVAVNICYEDVFGEEIITQLPEATILANISNDAWYGKSIAADQHLQFSQARALETGRMMLRATNTGATAAINQHGHIMAYAPQHETTTLNTQAQGYTGTTPYVRWGNWPFIIISFGVLAWLIIRRRKAPAH